MAPNEQQSQQYAPAQVNPGQAPAGPAPQPMAPSPAGGLPVPDYFANNPLQGGVVPAPTNVPAAGSVPVGVYQPPVGAQQPVAVPAPLQPPIPNLAVSGLPPQPQAVQVAEDDGDVASDDVVWVSRAKRAIQESQGDPYRKVQLIQHLRSAYLKQRFGRTVRTDEG